MVQGGGVPRGSIFVVWSSSSGCFLITTTSCLWIKMVKQTRHCCFPLNCVCLLVMVLLTQSMKRIYNAVCHTYQCFLGMVFKGPLQAMLEGLDASLTPDDHLYMGHIFHSNAFSTIKAPVGKAFVMTGSGALVRGSTLSELVASEVLERSIRQQVGGDRCWWGKGW